MRKAVAPVTDDPVVININLDSLGEAYNYPKGFRDPSFFSVFDRIQGLADKYGFKLSIYVIGRDLEDPEVYARVRHWSGIGHEIGNHTWTHLINFGAINPARIKDDIRRTHDRITECTEKEPKGFIAPNWSTSSAVVSALIDLKYLYDTSAFPSIFLYPAILKNAYNSIKNTAKLKRLLTRKDWLLPLRCPTEPHFVNRDFKRAEAGDKERILIIPMPVKNRFFPPCWHTLGFMFGWAFHMRMISSMLKNGGAFYYLMHPADFMGPEDLDGRFSHTLDRMNIPIREKMKRAEEVFAMISGSGRPVVTMGKMAEQFVTRDLKISLQVCDN